MRVPPLAYLASQYPAVNHTYILGEIRTLRSLGLEIHAASIASPDRPPERLTPEEREEMMRTFYIKTAGLTGILRAHASTLGTRPVDYFRGLREALRIRRGLLYFIEAVILGHWMAARGLRHVHIHFASTVGLIAGRIFPISVSNSIHGPAEFDNPAGFLLAEKIRGSLFVRAISHYGRSQLMRISEYGQWSKLEVSRLGVDPSRFQPRPFRDRPSPFEVISVGRLSPEKAQHVLLDAIARLIRQGRNVRLHLVGDGPDRASLERRASAEALGEHVVFEGWRSQDQLRALYAQSDACALASFLEGIPLALMEPMAMEIPCVATRITGVPELIRDGIEGLLVTPSDAGELACAIGRLMDDPALCRRLGQAARARVLRDYNLPANIAQLAALFERRLAAPEPHAGSTSA
jgi:glycosyltransferase involved in cell wall biosynthesis